MRNLRSVFIKSSELHLSSFVEGGAERSEREVGREGDTESKREMKGARDIR